MDKKIAQLRKHVSRLASDKRFRHHQWFVKYHLEVVEKIAGELLERYPDADSDIVLVMCWMHDYGKIIDIETQYARGHIDIGVNKMIELGFAEDFARQVGDYIEWMDKRSEVDLHEAPIEVQIVSTADACSHFATPFHNIYWYENPDKTIAEIVAGKVERIRIDWEDKLVLPEAKAAYQKFYEITRIQNGQLPHKYL